MSIGNTRQAYGWASIALHWISAVGVVALYLLGERMEEAPDRAAKLAAQDLHVSVAVLLFTFLAARLLWTAAQPKPAPLDRVRALRIIAGAVQVLFLLMILVLLVTGPLAVCRRAARSRCSTFAPVALRRRAGRARVRRGDYGAATKLFWPLIVLHVAGALKHMLVDRDATLQRILWVRRREA